MKKVVMLFLSILFCSNFNLQAKDFNLKGAVYDKKTNAPLFDVSIFIQDSYNRTATDSSGHFIIPVNEGETLVFSAIGYQLHKEKIKNGEFLKIFLLKDKSYLAKDVIVTAHKKNETALKVDVPIKEIPLTVQTLDASILEEREATDMGDAMKNVGGVRPINRYGGFQTFTFRGFNDFVLLVDGVRDERHNLSSSAPQTNLANVERIEVIKGPSSVLYGHSALGGIINVIRKKPTPYSTYNLSASYGSFNSKKIFAGTGGPLNDELSYRLDLGLTETDGWRDFGQRTANAYLALNYTPSKTDNFELQIGLNKDKYDTDTGIPVLEDGSFPEIVDLSTRYNATDDFLKHDRYDFQLGYTKEINDNLQLSNKSSFYYDKIDYLSTEELTYNESLDSLTRTYPYYFNHNAYPVQNQLELSYNFKTSDIEHKLLSGYSFNYMHRKTYYGTVIGDGKNATISVVDPILNQGYVGYIPTRYSGKDETTHGLYVQDWINISEKLKVMLGLRYDIFRGTYYTDYVDENKEVTEEGEKTDINTTAFTYRFGLVYHLYEPFTLYGSYSTYFKPTRTISSYGEVFDPEKGYQGEVGFRYELNNIAQINFAAFYIKKYDIVESVGKDTSGNTIYQQVGAADSKGVEVDLLLNYNEIVNVTFSYSFNEAKYLDYDTDDASNSNEGNYIKFAPKHMLKMWATCNVGYGFGTGLGINHVSENYTNAANTYKLPGYTVTDWSVFYNFDNSQIKLSVENLFDVTYFTDAIYNNQFFPGAERNFTLSYSLKY
ncbi:TonB-dependent siderophore receptor [Chloroherpeton thalassium ATCC 35110]|uniref:TonB-dependent siderophore receptor n=1 Tax=Chloroherpeton thalassium (strain ATCC 35110 / GB-78) TaxID=517418 RepID=B3QXU0_CHLT3|nr:TonB-dependent siderophore receptor [Chloroherpeton thalassium]ACF13468.1 TonB-dependent siderophore receptor [Chloroherpeton thalassium ATCC 35110]